MKRSLSLLFFSLFFFSSKAQELPEIIPPSPTVANLMKFEEVPVNNYSGIPDISIPIYSGKGINNYPIDISLSYHPSGITVDNISSWVGNGWSLNAGGAISRTVYGKPDDQQDGMLNNSFLDTDFILTDQIKFETLINDIYDTQSDIFQFNFMGMSGRFFLKNENGQITTTLITKNKPFKITPIVSGVFSEIIGFEVIDTNGFIYIFDSIEETTSIPYITSTPRGGGSQNVPILAQSIFNSFGIYLR